MVDSVRIGDVDFMIDSLYQVNNSLWHYLYSYGCNRPECPLVARQILIEVVESKIHFSFASEYSYYTRGEALKKNGYSSREYYKLQSIDSNSLVIHYSSYRQKNTDDGILIDSLLGNFELMYDEKKHIYYSSIEVLDGEYEFVVKEYRQRNPIELSDIIKLNLEDEKVFRIDLNNSHYVYFKEKWFKLIPYPYNRNRLIALLPGEELIGQHCK